MATKLFKCKNCGAELSSVKAVDGVTECEWCGSFVPVPDDVSPAALRYLHDGESSLHVLNFEDAYIFYGTAADMAPNEPEAYFGMALAEFEVEFIYDEVENRQQPICHNFLDRKFSESKNYLKALSLAKPRQREEYKRLADQIDAIRSEFVRLKGEGLDYDCFICTKVTTSEGLRTDDCIYADDLYFYLKGKGYTPFFSERELKGATGSDYEARILYALYTSECMIIVCGDEEYLRTKWVKNEYTRFARLMENGQKESDGIAVIYDGTPIDRLPVKGGRVQGVDRRAVDASERTVEFVQRHTPMARRQREEAARLKEAETDELKRKLEEEELARKKLEEKLRNMQSASEGAGGYNGNYENRNYENRNYNAGRGARVRRESFWTRAFYWMMGLYAVRYFISWFSPSYYRKHYRGGVYRRRWSRW